MPRERSPMSLPGLVVEKEGGRGKGKKKRGEHLFYPN